MSVSVATPPAKVSRSRTAIDRLRSGFGVARYELVEVEQLGELVTRRIVSDATMEPSLYSAWVASRFTFPLRGLLWQASRSTRGAVLLNLLVVAGGFATSGIAVASKGGKSSVSSWIVFTIGLIVAVAGGIAQLFRPAYRASERTSLAVDLREEGWAFATSSGIYDAATREAFEALDQRVTAIHRRAAKVSAIEPATQAPSQSGARRSGKRSRPAEATPGQ